MDILSIASLIVGIIGLLVGIWGGCIGYKGRRTQILEYSIYSSKIITNRINNIPGLKIAVEGEFASDLTLTEIEFTSQGNATINGSDFATLAPLKVTSSGHFFILDTINEDIITTNNENLNPHIEVADKYTLILSFEYLKPKESFSISVLHDGEISVSGDLKSGKLRRRKIDFESDAEPDKKNSLSIFQLAVLIFAVLSLAYSAYTINDVIKMTDDIINSSNEMKQENNLLQRIIDMYRNENQSLKEQLEAFAAASDLDSDGLPGLPGSDASPASHDSYSPE